GSIRRQVARMTFSTPESWGAPRGHSSGVLVAGGKLLVVAGQIAWNSEQRMVRQDIIEQFAQALGKVIAVVRAAGGTASDIAQLRVYVTDKQAYTTNLKQVGAAYRELMGRHYPAMALVEVTALVEDLAQVEIEAIACLPATTVEAS